MEWDRRRPMASDIFVRSCRIPRTFHWVALTLELGNGKRRGRRQAAHFPFIFFQVEKCSQCPQWIGDVATIHFERRYFLNHCCPTDWGAVNGAVDGLGVGKTISKIMALLLLSWRAAGKEWRWGIEE
jgi:hypothetical protein